MTIAGCSSVGAVTSFDEARGLGEVAGVDGGNYPFHCVVIADGTRTVPVGADVRFVVRAGMPGRWEAFDVAVLA